MSFKRNSKSRYALIFLFLLLTSTALSFFSMDSANLNNGNGSSSNDDKSPTKIVNVYDHTPESSDIIYTGMKYNLSEWWDTRFRFRIGIQFEELEGIDRYEPVDVYLTFQDYEHHVDSARLVSYNATGNDEWSSEIPIQLWNVSYYREPENLYIKSCTMTFLANSSANSNQTYFLYYNENLDNINPPSYNTNFESSLDEETGTLVIKVGMGSIYEAQLVEGQGVIKFEKDSVDFHSINSLAPERKLTDPRLVLFAHMDENSGTSVNDASGYLNPGKINGNVDWTEGVVDYGLQFGGSSVTNDTVGFGPVLQSSGDPFAAGTTKWTMTCWVKPTSLTTAATNHGTQNVIMAKASDNHNDNFEIGIVGSSGLDYSQIHVYLHTASIDTSMNFGIDNVSNIIVNQWNFITVRVDLTKTFDHVEVRINDNWFGSANTWGTTPTQMVQASGSNFTIGSSEHRDIYYTGVIDEVALYNNSLTDTEIESYKYGTKAATISSIRELIDGNGQVFSRYEVNWTNIFDMHVSDICSFYYDYNLWNINRTIYFDNLFNGTDTNTQMIPLNTYYDLTSLADSEDFYYFYDGAVENQGLIYDDFTVENYTIIHDPIHTDPGERWTFGLFIPKYYDVGTATEINYFKGNVTYDAQNNIVTYKPGYINDFYNNIGGPSNYLHIEFWEFIDNVYLSESAMIQLFEDQNEALKNPLNLYIYEKDAKL
jgi:hypothetical protein